MKIEYGTEVVDKNGKRVGAINRMIRDAYSSEVFDALKYWC